jgi:hypothetical protein
MAAVTAWQWKKMLAATKFQNEFFGPRARATTRSMAESSRAGADNLRSINVFHADLPLIGVTNASLARIPPKAGLFGAAHGARLVSPQRKVNSSSPRDRGKGEFNLKVSSTSVFSCHGCAMIRTDMRTRRESILNVEELKK